jgi:rhodanese-related sulfurtransferase
VRALRLLAAQGYSQVFSLKGGINAWAEQVDPTIRKY